MKNERHNKQLAPDGGNAQGPSMVVLESNEKCRHTGKSKVRSTTRKGRKQRMPIYKKRDQKTDRELIEQWHLEGAPGDWWD